VTASSHQDRGAQEGLDLAAEPTPSVQHVWPGCIVVVTEGERPVASFSVEEVQPFDEPEPLGAVRVIRQVKATIILYAEAPSTLYRPPVVAGRSNLSPGSRTTRPPAVAHAGPCRPACATAPATGRWC